MDRKHTTQGKQPFSAAVNHSAIPEVPIYLWSWRLNNLCRSIWACTLCKSECHVPCSLLTYQTVPNFVTAVDEVFFWGSFCWKVIFSFRKWVFWSSAGCPVQAMSFPELLMPYSIRAKQAVCCYLIRKWLSVVAAILKTTTDNNCQVSGCLKQASPFH